MAELKILVTGGGGYVGAQLVPRLLELGFEVNVIDLFLYGDDVLDRHPKLKIFKGDIRNLTVVAEAVNGCDVVIHLACISNDPSFELDPDLGRSINLDAFEPLVQASKQAGVSRFVYASSSSVYGVKEIPNVDETCTLEPLTDYSRFKANCEEILEKYRSASFSTVTLRPATVCGYSRRQRLDVVVNILTNYAFHNREITVFGGQQLRPNIHIDDMVEAYICVINADRHLVDGKIFNVGFENQSVTELANIVRSRVGEDVAIRTVPTDDNRSYHVSSDSISRTLGFRAKKTIGDAVEDLVRAFENDLLPNSLTDPKYINIKTMQEVGLS